MEYRIKKEHVGKKISKGNSIYILNADMSQQEILFIKNMVCADFVEEIKRKKVSKPKAEEQVENYLERKKGSRKNDNKDSDKSA